MMRTIKSYVLRQGRMTEAQERAFAEHWSHWGVDLIPGESLQQALLYPASASPRPWVMEIGFGNGDTLLQMAEALPEWDFLGVEVYRTGVGRVLNGIAVRGLSNLRVICADAVQVLNQFMPASSLSRLHVYFPDPWHKTRHHKRRLIQETFLKSAHQALKKEGELHCATDWEHYAYWIRDLLCSEALQNNWLNLGNAEGFAARPDFRPESKFERRGKRLGHGVWDLRYQKK